MIRMPPRSTAAEMDGYGPMLDMHSVLLRNYNPNPDLGAGLDVDKGMSSVIGHRWSTASSSDKNLRREAVVMGLQLGGGGLPPPPSGTTSRYFDITIYVGRNRAPYTVSSETLQGSAYFRMKIDSIRGEKFDSASSPIRPSPPLVVDCEESVFQNMLCLLRYGSLEALPRQTDADLFRLRKEVEFYGIDWPEPPAKNSSLSKAGTGSPKVTSPLPSSTASAATVTASTKPLAATAAAAGATNHRHISVAELPDFPTEIGDPAKLILVQRTDDDPRARCSCTAPEQQSTWALSFHHRHAFCTGCSKPWTNMLAPKFSAEMFMAAAAFYSGDHKLNHTKWGVGCDSTCTLKFLGARPCCTCPCSRQSTVWVVSTYHSHAFCSYCGAHADGSTLICILLTVRYGGFHRSPSKGKRCDHISAVDIPIGREAPKLQPAPSYKQR